MVETVKIVAFLLSMAACVAADAGTLRESSWMWGHDPGVYDGPGNEYNIPVSAPVPMAEASRRFGVPNLSVVRWSPADADAGYLKSLAAVKRFTWAVCGDATGTSRDALLKGSCAVMSNATNMVGIDFDDFFNPKDRFGHYSPSELDAIRATLRTMPGGVRREMRLVLYSHHVRPEIKPFLKRMDTVLFWTWCGADLKSIERNFAAYRAIAPKKRTLLGIYMWDFGGAKPIAAEHMRHQLSVALKLFRRGEIAGVVFHCTPLVNKNLAAVAEAKAWLDAHGDECAPISAF